MKVLSIFLLLFSVNTFAQFRLPVDPTGQVQYQEVVKIGDGKQTARQVMAQAKSWAEDHFESEEYAEQQFDPTNNILFLKHATPVNGQQLRYAMTIEAKYGRYRATITDLIVDNNGLALPVRASSLTVAELAKTKGATTIDKKVLDQTAKEQADLYQAINKLCRETLASLKSTMSQLR